MVAEPPHLTGRHQDTLRHVLAHPLSHNVEWHALVALLHELGSVEERGESVTVEAGGQRLALTRPHGKDVEADDLAQVRRFLETLGYRAGG
ncbi:MAG TPA: hypothetical protein VMD28_06215 [Acidimicrobiales bacterium]|nr:hypothetical protein [Acidimicrobiales bacterium]